VATAALAGALDLIAGLGGGTVEGYPEAAGPVPAGFLYNGALSTYEKLGFIRDRKIGQRTATLRPTAAQIDQSGIWCRELAPISSMSGPGRPTVGQGALRSARRFVHDGGEWGSRDLK
jgi:hypothetical protein